MIVFVVMDFGKCPMLKVQLDCIGSRTLQNTWMNIAEEGAPSSVDHTLCLRFRFGIERSSRIGWSVVWPRFVLYNINMNEYVCCSFMWLLVFQMIVLNLLCLASSHWHLKRHWSFHLSICCTTVFLIPKTWALNFCITILGIRNRQVGVSYVVRTYGAPTHSIRIIHQSRVMSERLERLNDQSLTLLTSELSNPSCIHLSTFDRRINCYIYSSPAFNVVN